MGGDDESPWWTSDGIASRWDESQDTGPPNVILAKFVREGAIPMLIALLAGGVIFAFAQWREMLSGEVFSVVVGVVGGVFALFYLEAGFKDSTLRDD